MTEIKIIKDKLTQHLSALRNKYKIKSLGIFGSYIRNEQKKGSDVDILVDFEGIITFFQFIDLEIELSELLGTKVDLVMKTALRPKIGEKILQEVSYL